MGDKEAGHLTHAHNSKCSRSHACPRTHMATHTVSHTWRLPNRQARPGTAPAGAHPSHAESCGGPRFTQARSHRCAGSPPRAHIHKHNFTLLRSLINTPGTALHTQARSGTRRPCGSRLADTPAEPSGTGAHPGTVELYTSHLPRRTNSTQGRGPQVLEFSGRGREGQARAKRRGPLGTDSGSHTHRCTGT